MTRSTLLTIWDVVTSSLYWGESQIPSSSNVVCDSCLFYIPCAFPFTLSIFVFRSLQLSSLLLWNIICWWGKAFLLAALHVSLVSISPSLFLSFCFLSVLPPFMSFFKVVCHICITYVPFNVSPHLNHFCVCKRQ